MSEKKIKKYKFIEQDGECECGWGAMKEDPNGEYYKVSDIYKYIIPPERMKAADNVISQMLKMKNSADKMIKDLVRFYDATQEACVQQKQCGFGHNDGWWLVVKKIGDRIEAEYSLARYRKKR